MKATKDNSYLGSSKVWKLVLKFSIPCVISLLLAPLYNIVDQIFIGNSEFDFLGTAATGVVFPLLIVTQAFSWWIGDGCAAQLSIEQGKQETSKAKKSIGTGIIFVFVISIILLIVALTAKEPILRLFGATDLTIDMASSYLTVLAIFFPFFMLQNMMAPVIRSDGSPIYALIALGVGVAINAILNPIFLYVANMGVEGVAWATVIGQFVSFVLTAIYFFKTKTFKLKIKDFIPDFKAFKTAMILGLNSLITQILVVIVSLSRNYLLAFYGNLSIYGPEIPISAFSVEVMVYQIIMNTVIGLAAGAQPIIGYNIGSKNYKRVKETYKILLIATLIISFTFEIINEAYPDVFILIFGDGGTSGELYMEYTRQVFRIFMMMFPLTCFMRMSSSFFQAVGKPGQALTFSLIREGVLLPVMIIIPLITEASTPGSGITSLLYASPVSDIATIGVYIALTVLYFKKLNKEEKLLLEEKENN